MTSDDTRDELLEPIFVSILATLCLREAVVRTLELSGRRAPADDRTAVARTLPELVSG